jgi:hypothetical protein
VTDEVSGLAAVNAALRLGDRLRLPVGTIVRASKKHIPLSNRRIWVVVRVIAHTHQDDAVNHSYDLVSSQLCHSVTIATDLRMAANFEVVHIPPFVELDQQLAEILGMAGNDPTEEVVDARRTGGGGGAGEGEGVGGGHRLDRGAG